MVMVEEEEANIIIMEVADIPIRMDMDMGDLDICIIVRCLLRRREAEEDNSNNTINSSNVSLLRMIFRFWVVEVARTVLVRQLLRPRLAARRPYIQFRVARLMREVVRL